MALGSTIFKITSYHDVRYGVKGEGRESLRPSSPYFYMPLHIHDTTDTRVRQRLIAVARHARVLEKHKFRCLLSRLLSLPSKNEGLGGPRSLVRALGFNNM
jgi:hypothetical protein